MLLLSNKFLLAMAQLLTLRTIGGDTINFFYKNYLSGRL